MDADGIRIGNENLAEIRAGHKADKIADAVQVQLVKNIIQQEERSKAVTALHNLVLGEFEGHQKGLLLPWEPARRMGWPSMVKRKSSR